MRQYCSIARVAVVTTAGLILAAQPGLAGGGGGGHGGGFSHAGVYAGSAHGGYFFRYYFPGFYGLGPGNFGADYTAYSDASYSGQSSAQPYPGAQDGTPGGAQAYPNVAGPLPGAAPQVYARPQPNAIYVRVRVPPEAEVWFDGHKTIQKGAIRFFETPPAIPGLTYAYSVRARWTQGGREVDTTREYTVYAGTKLSIDFMQPEREKIPPPTPKPAGD